MIRFAERSGLTADVFSPTAVHLPTGDVHETELEAAFPATLRRHLLQLSDSDQSHRGIKPAENFSAGHCQG